MSIAPPVGAMKHLSRLISSKHYTSIRHFAKKWPASFRDDWEKPRGVPRSKRGNFTGGTLFEELGFFYVGPIDGHNIDHLLPILKNIRDMEDAAPVLLHVVTEKAMVISLLNSQQINITEFPSSM